MTKKITIVESDDWEAIYIGNDLHRQDNQPLFYDNSLIEDFFNDLGYDVDVNVIQDDGVDEYLMENGQLPETLREVRKLLSEG